MLEGGIPGLGAKPWYADYVDYDIKFNVPPGYTYHCVDVFWLKAHEQVSAAREFAAKELARREALKAQTQPAD